MLRRSDTARHSLDGGVGLFGGGKDVLLVHTVEGHGGFAEVVVDEDSPSNGGEVLTVEGALHGIPFTLEVHGEGLQRDDGRLLLLGEVFEDNLTSGKP